MNPWLLEIKARGYVLLHPPQHPIILKPVTLNTSVRLTNSCLESQTASSSLEYFFLLTFFLPAFPHSCFCGFTHSKVMASVFLLGPTFGDTKSKRKSQDIEIESILATSLIESNLWSKGISESILHWAQGWTEIALVDRWTEIIISSLFLFAPSASLLLCFHYFTGSVMCHAVLSTGISDFSLCKNLNHKQNMGIPLCHLRMRKNSLPLFFGYSFHSTCLVTVLFY